jgi:uncharacterized tellurite resistance protein B-like protein
MVTKEKLYEAFGELIYAVAKADGIVQGEEVEALEKILKSHSWAQDIIWSFKYEAEKNHSIDYVYKKAMDIFKEHGPASEYDQLISVLQAVAKASQGVSTDEKGVINKFQYELIEKFKKDLSII